MSATGRTWTDTPACCPALPCRWRQSGAASLHLLAFVNLNQHARACFGRARHRASFAACPAPSRRMRPAGAFAGREAARRGGGRGDLTAPVQRLPDFLSGQVVPPSLFCEDCKRCCVFGALRGITCRGVWHTTNDMLQRCGVERMKGFARERSSARADTRSRTGVQQPAAHVVPAGRALSGAARPVRARAHCRAYGRAGALWRKHAGPTLRRCCAVRRRDAHQQPCALPPAMP